MAIDTTIALISLADAKLYLNESVSITTNDSIIGDIINEVSAMVNAYCGRIFLSATYTEYYNGNGLTELILRNYPIITLTSLYNSSAVRTFDSSTLVDTGNILTEKEKGIVRLWNSGGSFYPGPANVKVVYTAGYALASIPFDLQLAVRKWVAQQYYRRINRRHDVQSETIGDKTVAYLDKEIPSEVRGTLDIYKERLFAPDFAYV